MNCTPEVFANFWGAVHNRVSVRNNNDAGVCLGTPASLYVFVEIFFGQILFFTTVAVAAHEFINATGGVDEFLFAGEEGVA